MKWTPAVTRGTSVNIASASPLAVSVIAYWHALKSSFTGALRRGASAMSAAPTCATMAHAGPATSIVANAKVPRGRDFALDPASDDLEGDQLADQRADREERDLGGGETCEIRAVYREDPCETDEADDDDGGDVSLERGEFVRD